MQRAVYQDLVDWKKAAVRKPLLLQGARQVGKTYLLEHFASSAYQDHIYCNFEEDPSLTDLFSDTLSPNTLIENLGFYRGKKIIPEETLIIFDEIQLAERAITSLKYFYEKAKTYHVIAAGSLLGVSMGQQSSFPVGKVSFLDLYPLNFLEYLNAVGESMLVELLQDKTDFTPIAKPLHEKLSYHFRRFLYIGGMPEVVKTYVEQADISAAQKIQTEIHKSYASDFSKYAEPIEFVKISKIWQNIPFQLAKENKKFKFSDLEKGARYSRYELALEWLRKAGLIHLSYRLTTAKTPIQTYSDSNIFKLYYLDTGLLTARLNAPPRLIASDNLLYTEFKGALIENYIAKELKPFVHDDYLYYWSSKSAAEIDFVIELEGHVLPIEVKSGYSKHKKSLMSFCQKYNPAAAIRLSPRNFTQDDRFINLPLYAASVMMPLLKKAL